MSDYLDVMLHAPLYTYHFFTAVVGFVVSLPWPPGKEFFGSMVIFIAIYPVRIVMSVVFPEKQVVKRLYRRRETVPTDTEHQVGASAASNIFHHF